MQDVRCDLSMVSDKTIATISFAQRMVASEGFKALFREGMTLVEETAAYLDGPGRSESRALSRPNNECFRNYIDKNRGFISTCSTRSRYCCTNINGRS